MLYLSSLELPGGVEGTRSVFVNGHRPPTARGGRVYLYLDGRVRGWRQVEHVKPLPNGSRIEFVAGFQPCDVLGVPGPPVGGVMGGRHGSQAWRRATWERGGTSSAP